MTDIDDEILARIRAINSADNRDAREQELLSEFGDAAIPALNRLYESGKIATRGQPRANRAIGAKYKFLNFGAIRAN